MSLFSLKHEPIAKVMHLDTVRANNNQVRDLPAGMVGVFVGGTSGIGESTVKAWFTAANRPRAYAIGRNPRNGQRLVSELHSSNITGHATYVRKDISTLKSVDEVCEEIKKRERKINFLVLTAGYLAIHGRKENSEGLDRKMTVNFYARMRFIHNLMPLLTIASEENQLSRVCTVLAAGSEGDIRLDDLDLKSTFSLSSCLTHCVLMTDFTIEEYAKLYPGTSFIHSYPGTVKTNIAKELSGPARLAVKLLYALLTPWIMKVEESGERNLFQMTSAAYPPKRGPEGIPRLENLQVTRGTTGEYGTGAYLLDWDGQAVGDFRVLSKYRELGLGKLVMDHLSTIYSTKLVGQRKNEQELAAASELFVRGGEDSREEVRFEVPTTGA